MGTILPKPGMPTMASLPSSDQNGCLAATDWNGGELHSEDCVPARLAAIFEAFFWESPVKQLIQVGALLAVLAVSSGRLPQILHAIRVAQLQLIKESQTSSWGRAMLLPSRK
jgi:hypothetical protein